MLLGDLTLGDSATALLADVGFGGVVLLMLLAVAAARRAAPAAARRRPAGSGR